MGQRTQSVCTRVAPPPPATAGGGEECLWRKPVLAQVKRKLIRTRMQARPSVHRSTPIFWSGRGVEWSGLGCRVSRTATNPDPTWNPIPHGIPTPAPPGTHCLTEFQRRPHLEHHICVVVVLQHLGQDLPHAAAVLGLVVPALSCQRGQYEGGLGRGRRRRRTRRSAQCAGRHSQCQPVPRTQPR